MHAKLLFNFFVLLLLTVSYSKANTTPPSEQICGKWESAEKNLIVQVYMQDNKFMAKVIWYTDTGGKPMDYWTDRRNPDPALRSRKILGMSILNGLRYDKDSNTWEDGMIYESKNGRYWNASVKLDKAGRLEVRGYWHFKFIGRTMVFTRV